MDAEPEVLTPLTEPGRRRRWPRVVALSFIAVTLVCCGSAAVLARLGRPLVATPFNATTTAGAPEADAIDLRKHAVQAEKELSKLHPKGVYIVVDTFQNRLRLVENGKVIRSAVCSTGTGIVLKDPRNGKQWVFDTPVGERVVERKVKHPVWAKPDWAFIEEGWLPPKDPNERFDDASLGDYALYIGDGFIIHGTLFKSLLGRRVTHGCIRLGDEDLEFVYRHAPIGTRVYLY
jgi:hypothetical protein